MDPARELTDWLDQEAYPRLAHSQVFGDLQGFRRSGQGYVALCPAHDDHHPSFSMPDGRVWGHCYACGHTRSWWAHTAARVGHGRAVILELARMAGVPPPSGVESADTRLASVADAAREAFQSAACAALWTDNGADVLDYLRGRGYSDAEIRGSGLGVWPGNTGRGVDGQEFDARALGITYYGAGRSHRLVIPLRDHRGRLAGFALRQTSGEGDGHKYLYSRGYDRSGLLPGLRITEQPPVLVEGLIDALILSERGMHAAALGGAHITAGQIALLERLRIQRVVLSLDEDDAGRTGTEAAVRQLLERTMRVYVVPDLAGAKDPDEFMRSHSFAAYADLVRQAKSGARWLAERLMATRPSGSDAERDVVMAEIVEMAAHLADPLATDAFLDVCAGGLGIDRKAIDRAVAGRHEVAMTEQRRRLLTALAADVSKMATAGATSEAAEGRIDECLAALRGLRDELVCPLAIAEAREVVARTKAAQLGPWPEMAWSYRPGTVTAVEGPVANALCRNMAWHWLLCGGSVLWAGVDSAAWLAASVAAMVDSVALGRDVSLAEEATAEAWPGWNAVSVVADRIFVLDGMQPEPAAVGQWARRVMERGARQPLIVAVDAEDSVPAWRMLALELGAPVLWVSREEAHGADMVLRGIPGERARGHSTWESGRRSTEIAYTQDIGDGGELQRAAAAAATVEQWPAAIPLEVEEWLGGWGNGQVRVLPLAWMPASGALLPLAWRYDPGTDTEPAILSVEATAPTPEPPTIANRPWRPIWQRAKRAGNVTNVTARNTAIGHSDG